jgi:hypothetical protein
MEPGKPTSIRLLLDACGYRFKPGHRIRLSLSTSYWPTILPAPTDPGLTIDIASIGLAMPKLGDHMTFEMKQPDNPGPLPTYKEHAPARTERKVVRDMSANRTDYCIYEDTGLFEHPDTGLSTQQIRDETWSISPDDPLSMTGTSVWTCDMRRPGWFVRTIATSRLTCTRTDWLISASVIAYEGESKIFEKVFPQKAIRRDLM